ncbi:hypothetical protein [Sphingomonas pituitosa]|uniref:hypothetical protein n=1 Tax=Sphingomonas pituitosa TaxID=99597 RepID=UPI00082F1F99|nr:hypothetical protein [Sphingomonas pituitosa]
MTFAADRLLDDAWLSRTTHRLVEIDEGLIGESRFLVQQLARFCCAPPRTQHKLALMPPGQECRWR